jgi:hypothetical protein
VNTSAFHQLDLCLLSYILVLNFFQCSTTLRGLMPPHSLGFEITCRHTTLGRTALDEGSACRRERQQQTSTHPAGLKPATPVSELQQTHVLDRVATGIGLYARMISQGKQRFVSYDISLCDFLQHIKRGIMPGRLSYET